MSAEKSHEPKNKNWIRGLQPRDRRQLTAKPIYIKRSEREAGDLSPIPG